MRIPASLAWLLVLSTFATAGLLRQFHDRTPTSPYAPAAVGSLLFAAVLFVLLVWAREWRSGASPGPGVRLGSLMPLLAMLLGEKWISIFLYNPAFEVVARPERMSDARADAVYRAFAGVALLLTCLLFSRFSRPASRRTARSLAPRRLLVAIGAVAGAVAATYGLLGALPALLGHPFAWRLPLLDATGIWVVAGQGTRGLSEEIYYRGLLLQECGRLAPRLGASGASARRWAAIFPPALLFGLEHLVVAPGAETALQEWIFATALGLLFGLLVTVTENLWIPSLLHAWINVLLLGRAPVWTDAMGRPAPPSGTYVALALVFAFVGAWLLALRRRAPLPRRA